jgi:hypothetical protein
MKNKPKNSSMSSNLLLIKQMEGKFNKLPVKCELTPEQEKEIKDYFYNLLGESDVPTIWHKFCYSRNGIYSKEYLPMTITRKLINWANKTDYRNAYADKNMLDVVLPNAPHPEIIMKNMNGYYYFNGKPVNRQEAIELCNNLGRVIIKPSLKSQGRDIRIIEIKDGLTNYKDLTVAQLFDLYNKNYCIQKIINQHEDMKKLNSSSVNTIRILTYRSDMEILVLYTAIRIGRQNSDVDNESSGGISANIKPDGTLVKYGISKPEDGQIEKTDNGTILEGYVVPSYDKAVKMAQEQHFNLPFFDIIAWDIAIREDGEPIIIEWNVLPGLSQSACGPALGNYTERIINELKEKSKTRIKKI